MREKTQQLQQISTKTFTKTGTFMHIEYFPLEHKNIVLSVTESFEEAQKITQDSEIFHFHCVKNWEPILKVNRKVMQ